MDTQQDALNKTPSAPEADAVVPEDAVAKPDDAEKCTAEDLAKVAGGSLLRLDNHGRKPPL